MIEFEDEDPRMSGAPPSDREPSPLELEPDADLEGADSIEDSACSDASNSPGDPVQEPPPDPQTPSAISQAREAREVAGELTDDAYKALWLEVALWPLKHGTLLGVILLSGVAAAMSVFDGGATKHDRLVNDVLQLGVGTVALLILSIYARRIVFNTVENDRSVPWGKDLEDGTPWLVAVKTFVSVVVLTLAPLLLWVIFSPLFDLGHFLRWGVALGLTFLAAGQLPLALVGVTVKDNITAALPGSVWKVWKVEPYASRVAAVTSIVFVSLLLLSFAFSSAFDPADVKKVVDDSTFLRNAGRFVLMAVRVLAFYAGLVSFRVAGLLVRDVPQVREALR